MVSSYLRHELEEQTYAEQDDLPWCYKKPNSIGNWHHERMLGSIGPLLDHSPNTSWVTIGDGRFGSDANYLSHRVKSVTATSISGATLKIAHERGWIKEFSTENGESLSFPDGSFDFVLCKETYHHFPRPAIALYEMLRVARQGVVLIEPMDGIPSPLLAIKRAIKTSLRGADSYDRFEPSGNFVFRVNVEEIRKSLTALEYPAIAWKGLNTFWHKPFDPVDYKRLSVAKAISQAAITGQDLACRLRLLCPGLAVIICFKQTPETSLSEALRRARFDIQLLPNNPYT